MATDSDDLPIAENAAAPASAEDDAGKFAQHKLADQLAADRYLRGRAAAARRALPVRLGVFRPPGAI